MAKKKTESVDVMEMLGEQAEKTEKKSKKKDELPVVELEDTEKNRKILDAWIKHKREVKAADTKLKKQEEKLKPVIAETRTDFCLSNKYHSAVKIQCGDDVEEDGKVTRKSEQITASFQRKCAKISTKHKAKLKEIFGEDYDKSFQLNTSVKLTEAAMRQVEAAAAAGEPTIIQKLMEALGGKERFFEIFTVSQELVAKDYLYEASVSDKDVAAKAKKAREEGIFVPQKPTLSL